MRVLKFILFHSKPHHLYLWGMFFAVCFIALDNAIKPFLIKALIDTISHQADYNPWVICIYYSLLQFTVILVWLTVDYCSINYINKFRLSTTDYFMKRFYSYSFFFFQNHSTGSLISKFSDIFKYSAGLVHVAILQFARFILLAGISLFFLSKVAPVFVITLTIWIIIFFAITSFSIRKGMQYTKENAAERSKLLGFMSDYLGNILNVKNFVTENFELQQIGKVKNSFSETSHKQGFYFIKFYAIQGILTSAYIIGFIICLIKGFQTDKIGAGSFTLVVILNFNIINMVYETAYSLREFVVNWGTVDQALSILENFPEIQDTPDALELHVKEGEIKFSSVKFHYKDTSSLFEDKSIVIKAYQKVGLVGYSGSGKTTFINLILRLYDITSGRIMIDEQDIKEITQDSLRKNIAMIPQEPSLFHRSIMENIRYGRIEATDEEVIVAAKKAHAHEFIIKLPQGYNSLVGERGIKLSGGQRQRIAIARAILKNAPILILDEATSQLDSITESYIQESLRELMQNKTTIVIAHRLSTLLHMDRILVFDQGKIVQDGSHIDLLEQGGLYRTMWNTQAGGILPHKRMEEPQVTPEPIEEIKEESPVEEVKEAAENKEEVNEETLEEVTSSNQV